jgi:hypothetical protein
VLEIDIENIVTYINDTEFSRLASNPVKTAIQPRPFCTFVAIGDIVRVNGKPAKGTLNAFAILSYLAPLAVPGTAIADVFRGGIGMASWEILRPDGAPIGTLMGMGLGGGSAPPGAPPAHRFANLTIVGGTGAFVGARGVQGEMTDPIEALRPASTAEDPGKRRDLGGGALRYVLTVIPLHRPEVLANPSGPAVFHSSDFSQVSAARPARPGELLSLYAAHLGPTSPSTNPDTPFPAAPLCPVTSPTEVLINGREGEVTYAGGFAGGVNVYQVNFRVPPEAQTGLATLELRAAYIPGPAVKLPIQR